MTLLIKNGTILTRNPEMPVLYRHGIVIEGDCIASLEPLTQCDESLFDDVIDARGMVVMPGFINAHMHFYSSFATGLTGLDPSHDFQQVLRNLWWKLDRELTREDCYLSAAVACLAAIRHGTTTIIDHHASPGAVDGSLDDVALAVLDSGLRANLCYEVSDRDGAGVADAGLAENVRFATRLLEDPNERLRACLGLHASFTLSDETLNRCVEQAERLDLGLHIHVAEDRSDQEDCLARHGMRVIHRLERHAALRERSIFAHGVHLDASEMAVLADRDVAVTYQPQSNMNNGVGIMDLSSLSDAGVTVGLGTDAMTVNMIEEMRVGIWAQRLRSGDPSVGFSESIRALTQTNPAIASRFWEKGLGQIRPGYLADLILVDYFPFTELNPQNLDGHLAFGMNHSRVDTTIVGGRILMRGGEVQGLDVNLIIGEARSRSRALWHRLRK